MNPEKLHDALNQLPDDLIAAADILRQTQKPKIILWKRLVPIAACCVLVLGALYLAAPFLGRKGASQDSMVMQNEAMSEMEMYGAAETRAADGEPESPAEDVPMEAAPEGEGSGRGEDNSGAPLAPDMEEQAGTTASSEIAVTCRTYCIGAEETDGVQVTVISTAKEWDAYLAENLRLAEAEGFVNPYDESYFEENQLIAVVTTAASSSLCYEVDTIQKTGTGTWELTGIRYSPDELIDDMTQQCLLVELPRLVEPEDTVTLNLETEKE